MRTEACPICAGPTLALTTLELGPKPPLPATLPFRICGSCNFAFSATGEARDYAAFYAAIANDGHHREV